MRQVTATMAGFLLLADCVSAGTGYAAADHTLNRIADGCMAENGAVTVSRPDQVVCEFRMGPGERIAARLLLGEPFAPAPRAFIRFIIVPRSAALSRVQAVGWVEDSRSPWARHTADLAGERFQGEMRAFLFKLGGSPQPA